MILPLIIFTSCKDTKQTKEKPYLVIVSLDGFRWDYADMAKTPTLDSLAKSGVKANPCHRSLPGSPRDRAQRILCT